MIVCFQVAIRSLGFEIHKEEVRRLLAEYDRERAEAVDFDAFREISLLGALDLDTSTSVPYCFFFCVVTEKMAQRDPQEEMLKAFKQFDDDGTGKISLKNLRRVAKELGEELPDSELQAMIDEFDRDQDGESLPILYNVFLHTSSSRSQRSRVHGHHEADEPLPMNAKPHARVRCPFFGACFAPQDAYYGQRRLFGRLRLCPFRSSALA